MRSKTFQRILQQKDKKKQLQNVTAFSSCLILILSYKVINKPSNFFHTFFVDCVVDEFTIPFS